MKLEDQVISLDLAKRLKELGVKQESLWHYGEVGLFVWDDQGNPEYEPDWELTTSAFTVAELGEMLPARITNPETRNMDRLCFYLREHKGDDSKQDMRDGFTVEYWTNYSAPLIRLRADTEANARAKMLIYLLENKLLIPSNT